MEEQSLQHPQFMPVPQAGKTNRISNSRVTSPPTSPTVSTSGVPASTMQSPVVKSAATSAKPTNQATHLQEVPKNKGWTSFDESPVHLLPTGDDQSATQLSWGLGKQDDNWTAFPVSAFKHEADQDSSGFKKQTKASVSQITLQAHSTNVQHAPVKNRMAVLQKKQQSFEITPKPASSNINFPKKTLPLSQSNISYKSKPGNIMAEEHNSSSKMISSGDDDKPVNTVASDGDAQDPWSITAEQRQYYTKQFSSMQKDIKGKIDGQTARNFFTRSKLPIIELSHIWELSDMDQDGHLTLDEFCTAFHLVVARKNSYALPSQLPQALVPTLIDIAEADHSITGTGTASEIKANEQWETFSDRTSSSTTLANFDQVPESTQENLHHPVALRMSPSTMKHWAKVEDADGVKPSHQTEVVDEDSTTSSPKMHVRKQRSATNPYGYLRNEFSEPDSGCEENAIGKKQFQRTSSDSSNNRSHECTDEEKTFEQNLDSTDPLQPHSSVASSASSVTNSNKSFDSDSSREDGWVQSDLEHSDWSSRPLRPRSSSSSSENSNGMPNPVPFVPTVAPIPPPRPNLVVQASPLPKARTIGAVAKVVDQNPPEILPETNMKAEKPAPPPRPQVNAHQDTSLVQQESFADFANFNQNSQPEEKVADSVSDVQEKQEDCENTPSDTKIKSAKPVETVVPRIPRDTKNTPVQPHMEKEIKGTEQDKSLHNKKPPSKPPRTRMMSSDACKPETLAAPLTISTTGEEKIPSAPQQEAARNKSDLQTSIRELKNRNTQLMRLNADLQQQLKNVMEKRITIEMNIHQMRPFTQ